MRTHRLIPSRFPPVSLFEWAETPEELAALAALESLTNDRLGDLSLVPEEDWVLGPGSTVIMAAFTHPGPSRFTNGSFGVYYAADTLDTAIAETVYHRERFLNASNEGPTFIQMREYIAQVQQPLEKLDVENHVHLLNPDANAYQISQDFGLEKRNEKIWGLHYPSVRKKDAHCVAIFRPPALTMPLQGCHLEYIWDGEKIGEVRLSSIL
ncbi:MAG: RES family NAD+ phosphorylase [Gammaproteobacteria bacterium]